MDGDDHMIETNISSTEGVATAVQSRYGAKRAFDHTGGA